VSDDQIGPDWRTAGRPTRGTVLRHTQLLVQLILALRERLQRLLRGGQLLLQRHDRLVERVLRLLPLLLRRRGHRAQLRLHRDLLLDERLVERGILLLDGGLILPQLAGVCVDLLLQRLLLLLDGRQLRCLGRLAGQLLRLDVERTDLSSAGRLPSITPSLRRLAVLCSSAAAMEAIATGRN
jgi:hypothetical protein